MQDDKNKLQNILIISGIVIFILIYLSGILAQIIFKTTTKGDGWSEVPTDVPLSFSPPIVIHKAFTSGRGILLIFAIFAFVVVLFILSNKSKNKNLDERNFKHSEKGTYGTSGWMNEYEKKEILDIKKIENTDGTVLGMEDNGYAISLPQHSMLNKHVAIYGASGTGKSRCFVRNQILQCSKRKESIIITDPKGEIYADTSQYLKNLGYNVKVFNLVDPQFSDSWNCLGEITKSKDQIELMAQTFCDVIIKNTSGVKSDHFWDNAEMSLLKALCLYVATDNNRDEKDKNIGAVYELLTTNNYTQLSAKFSTLQPGHPALPAWNIYDQAGENIRGNIIIGLGSRLQVFQADIIKKITQFNEIDLEEPGKSKCAYYVIMSDQESTLNFLSSLFFSFLFIRLVKYADVHGKGGKCEVPVNFVLDEFPNIGQIPDFTKKLSTIRSRDLRVAVIFQNIAQLQNRYPNGLWEEIVGNCDTQLFLGCTEPETAKFISERTGEMTIEVSSTAVNRQTIAIAEYIPEYKETSSVGKRYLLTPDEVLRLDNKSLLIILRGQKVLKAKKFDFSHHPLSKYFVESPIRDHIPEWRKERDSIKEKNDKISEEDKKINEPTVSSTAVPADVELIKTGNFAPPKKSIKEFRLKK